MSLWHLPQVALVMKKFEGMVCPTSVSPEEGKKGLFGPAPSPSIERGGNAGFTIGVRTDACLCWSAAMPPAKPMAAIASPLATARARAPSSFEPLLDLRRLARRRRLPD